MQNQCFLGVLMSNDEIERFLDACDELINCKFLVAEYKIAKLLKSIASSSDICDLISECLSSYNRDREFARTYVQDSHGQFVCLMPTDEYKIVALVFCTLADIDNKKIDFTDFVKRFFGRDENPYQSFVETMIIPFKSLIAEAFGYKSGNEANENEEDQENYLFDEVQETGEEEFEEGESVDKFEQSTKVAVQILAELEQCRQSIQAEDAYNMASSIIKTANLRDEVVLKALTAALKYVSKYIKPIKFLVRELSDLVFD